MCVCSPTSSCPPPAPPHQERRRCKRTRICPGGFPSLCRPPSLPPSPALCDTSTAPGKTTPRAPEIRTRVMLVMQVIHNINNANVLFSRMSLIFTCNRQGLRDTGTGFILTNYKSAATPRHVTWSNCMSKLCLAAWDVLQFHWFVHVGLVKTEVLSFDFSEWFSVKSHVFGKRERN